jgi:hypothetical protein
MAGPTIPDKDFIEQYRLYGPTGLSQKLGIHIRGVFNRRNRLEAKHGVPIDSPNQIRPPRKEYPHRIHMAVPNGVVIIAGDAHYWPGPASLMHRALVATCKEYKPKLVILNGDVIDAPTISRHPPIGWEHRPALIDEIEAAQDRLHEIEKAVGKAQRTWNLGNHDARYETRLAQVAPEYAKMHGVHLSDHFSLWQPAWSTWINDDVVVKHRFKGGIHAPHNNTIWAGKSMITGHLHSAKVIPFTDYNGTRYGVDAGCIAETDHKAFTDYTEDNPLNWRSAFCVLTFRDGKMMQPELVLKWDDERVQFRGWVGKP